MGQGAATVRSVLVLWDVDHTLIENNGVSKKTYALAFELLTGRRAEYPAETDGRTDPEIMRNMLISNGIDPTDDQLACVSEALENAMSSNASELRDRGYALPGARAVLETLQRTSGIVQSVLSGNIAPNALIKLSVFDLNSYLDFDVGGYGSDDFVRSKLVGIARDRASAKYHAMFDETTTVLIGDTPRDVQAARDGGARVFGVASGSGSVERLSAAGADVVFRDLRDTQAVVAAVTSLQGR